MSQDLVEQNRTIHLPAIWEEEHTKAKAYAKEQHAQSTRRAYESDIKIFGIWCEKRGVCSLPALPETVAVFLSSQAETQDEKRVSVSTLGRRLAAIKYLHSLAGQEPPTGSEIVKATMKGIKRTLGAAVTPKATARLLKR
jgi:site-specific recombinase XerD